MTQLPALTAEEKAFLAGDKAEQSAVMSLAEQIRGRLTAALALPVQICAAEAQPSDRRSVAVPVVDPGPELIDCWVSRRFGALTGTWNRAGSDCFANSLVRLLQRALAETVFNLGHSVGWPEAIRLELEIGEKKCRLDFHVSPQALNVWAELEMKEGR